MGDYLFTYGTLKPGRAPEEISFAVRRFKRLGRGSIRGHLFDLGEFPGAKLDDSSGSKIFGTVFEIPKDPSLLQALDRYEEFYPSNRNKSLFVRKRCAVQFGDETLNCWIYEYNRSKHAKNRALGRQRLRVSRIKSRKDS